MWQQGLGRRQFLRAVAVGLSVVAFDVQSAPVAPYGGDKGGDTLLSISEDLLLAFDTADANRNGQLSMSEAESVVIGLAAADFDAIDTDGDGGLVASELYQVVMPEAGDIELGVIADALLQDFDIADTNQNGQLSLTEAQTILADLTNVDFASLDVNENGGLSGTELFNAVSRGEGARDQESIVIRLLSGFDTADLNRNGRLTLAEARTLVSGLTQASFDALDENSDASVTVTELFETTVDEPSTPAELADIADTLLGRFDTADEDLNGRLSQEEAESVVPNLTGVDFDALDANGDGRLSVGELFEATMLDDDDDEEDPDVLRPIIIDGPVVDNSTRTSLLLTWKTQVAALGRVRYGTSEDTLNQTIEVTEASGSQQAIISGLAAGTEYFFEVEAQFPETELTSTSAVLRATTATVQDLASPEFVALPSVAGITDTAVLLQWTTNEIAFGEVVASDTFGVVQVVETVAGTMQAVVVSDLSPATEYTFAVSANDATGNRSRTTLTATTAALPDLTEPEIVEGILVERVSDTSIWLRWQTSELATSTLNFGEDSDLSLQQSLPGLRREHHVPLVGLEPSTTYSMEIASEDWRGNGPVATSAFVLVTLPVPEMDVPVFTVEPTLLGTTDTSATIYWETDEPATTEVQYGTSTSRTRRAVGDGASLRHLITLAGLTPGTNYFFAAVSEDFEGNRTEVSTRDGGSLSFATDASADVTPPAITAGPTVTSVTDDGFTVQWTTDEPADSYVTFGAVGNTERQTFQDGQYVLHHTVTLRGLTADTDYEVVVSSADVAGNDPVAGDVLMVSTGDETDETAPEFSDMPVVEEITRNTALLRWSTDELSSCDIAIGLEAGAYEMIQATPSLATEHMVLLTNLDEGTRYAVVVRATDQNQNSSLAEAVEFATEGVRLENLPQHIIIAEGQRRLFMPTSVDPEDTAFTFVSDNPSVATADDRGVISGVSEGQARVTITANSSMSTWTMVVTVFTPSVPIDGDARGFFSLLGLILLQNGDSGVIGPCFIATAAEGSPMAASIDVLRHFRDEWLLTNGPGTMFVDAYYNASPPMADAVAKRPLLAALVRVALVPVVAFLAVWMAFPIPASLALIAMGVLLVRRWHRRRTNRVALGC